jgi:hypothetical protein
MQPHPRIVEFAIRDEQEAERSAQKRLDRQEGFLPAAPAPSLARRGLRASGRLLVALGVALERLGRAETFGQSEGGEVVAS